MDDFETEAPEVPWHKRLLYLFGNLGHFHSNKCGVTIQDSVRFQKMMGFGGALTGSVVFNLGAVPEALEDSLLESYYSKDHGIGYSMLRMAIGGSDFDFAPWAYNESPKDDRKLSNFTQLDAKDLLILKRIKKIQKMVGEKDRLKIKAAAWSCPKWMRSPNRRGGPGVLKQEYYQTWADYHIRFLELMQKEDVDIWALSTGNEPLNGIIGWIVTPWMNLGWYPKDVAQYVVENLGPTLRNSSFRDVLILAGDDQRTIFPWYFQEMKNSFPAAFDYIDGLAVHSYLDSYMPPEMLSWGQEAFPDQFILNTESSIGDIRYSPRGPLLGSWDRAVEYIRMYMQSFKNSVVGWIDWNLALDESGGPNYVKNTVESPVVINATGAEAYKQPIFYAIGHFSKFIHEGSVRIDVQSDWDMAETIAFRRPDNVIVLLIHNRFIETIEVKLNDEQRGSKVLQLPPESITTLIYKAVI